MSMKVPENQQEIAPISGTFKIAVDAVPANDVAAFSLRDTMVAATEVAPTVEKIAAEPKSVPYVQKVTSQKALFSLGNAPDARLHSDNLDEAFNALDEHVAFTTEANTPRIHQIHQKAVDGLQRDIDHQNIQQRHVELTQRNLSLLQQAKNFYKELKNDVKETFASVTSSIGGFFKKLIPSPQTMRKAVLAGALAATAVGGCAGEGCNGCNGCSGRGLVDTAPVASASASGSASAAPSVSAAPSAAPTASASAAPSAVPSAEPSAAPSASAEAPKPIDKAPKVPQAPKKPEKAKVILNPTPKNEPPKKPEQKIVKKEENKNRKSTENTDLDAEDATRLREKMTADLELEKQDVANILNPTNGPVYIGVATGSSSKPEPIKFDARESEQKAMAESGTSKPVEGHYMALSKANKDLLEGRLATTATMIAEAKSFKDFENAHRYMKATDAFVKSMILRRANMIGDVYDASNDLNARNMETIFKNLEKTTGKRVVPVDKATNPNVVVDETTIRIPVDKILMSGSQQDMLKPIVGDDFEANTKAAETKIAYNKAMLDAKSTVDGIQSVSDRIAKTNRPRRDATADYLDQFDGVAAKPAPSKPKTSAYSRPIRSTNDLFTTAQ